MAPVLELWTEKRGTSQTVVEDNNKAANITLGLALVFHHFIFHSSSRN